MPSELALRFNEFFGKEELNHPILVGGLYLFLVPIGVVLSYFYIRPMLSLNMGVYTEPLTLIITVVIGILLIMPILFLFIYLE